MQYIRSVIEIWSEDYALISKHTATSAKKLLVFKMQIVVYLVIINNAA